MPVKSKSQGRGRPRGSKAGKGKFGDLLKKAASHGQKGLALAQQLSAATGIKPSDLLAGTNFGQSTAGSLGSLGLASLGLGKKKGKGKPRGKRGGCRGNPACKCGYGRNKSGNTGRGKCAQCGGGLFDFIGDALGGVSNFVGRTAGKVLNPLARTALPLLAGTAQAVAPVAGALPAVLGMGKKGKRGGAKYPVSSVPGQTSAVVKF